MTATWEIETQIIPSYINENKGNFLKNSFYTAVIIFVIFLMLLSECVLMKEN